MKTEEEARRSKDELLGLISNSVLTQEQVALIRDLVLANSPTAAVPAPQPPVAARLEGAPPAVPFVEGVPAAGAPGAVTARNAVMAEPGAASTPAIPPPPDQPPARVEAVPFVEGVPAAVAPTPRNSVVAEPGAASIPSIPPPPVVARIWGKCLSFCDAWSHHDDEDDEAAPGAHVGDEPPAAQIARRTCNLSETHQKLWLRELGRKPLCPV